MGKPDLIPWPRCGKSFSDTPHPALHTHTHTHTLSGGKQTLLWNGEGHFIPPNGDHLSQSTCSQAGPSEHVFGFSCMLRYHTSLSSLETNFSSVERSLKLQYQRQIAFEHLVVWGQQSKKQKLLLFFLNTLSNKEGPES